MEITLALIKPHVVKNVVALQHITDIISRHFNVLQTKEVTITKQLASRFYEEHQGRFFYDRLVTFMGSGPSVALILSSKGSIAKWRTMLGPTKVYQAIYSSPDSIRALYGLSDTRNACHGSDSLESASLGALVHIRPDSVAKDGTTSIASVREFMDKHKTIKKLALFQCTSVFLKLDYVIKAFELFKTSECVFATTRTFKLRWSLNADGSLIPLNFDPKNRPRRQDWSGELVETGMFYFATRELIEQNVFQSDRCSNVVVSSKDALEIDTMNDLNVARCIVEKENPPPVQN